MTLLEPWPKTPSVGDVIRVSVRYSASAWEASFSVIGSGALGRVVWEDMSLQPPVRFFVWLCRGAELRIVDCRCVDAE